MLGSFIGVLLGAVGAAESGGEPLARAASLIFGDSGKEALDIVRARWAAVGKAIPANHDLEQAIRLGELTATLFLVTQYRRQWEADNSDNRSANLPEFIASATQWLDRQVGFCATWKTVEDPEIVRKLDESLDVILPSDRPEIIREALGAARSRVWTELVRGAVQPPADFEPLFLGSDDQPGWPLVFLAFMREALKTNPRAEVAFVNSRHAAVRTKLAQVKAKLDAMDGKLDDIGAVGARLSPPTGGVTPAWRASYGLALSALGAYLISICAAT